MGPKPLLFAAVALLCAIAACGSNAIQIENAKPGSPDWQIDVEASGQIEGYASATSINVGESLNVFVNTTDSTYTISVYRLGWYGGVGGRKVAGPVSKIGHQQTIPAPDPVTGMVECNWTDPYTVTAASDWTSGVYVAKLTTDHLTDSAGHHYDKYVIFVVRDDARASNHYFAINTNTSEAYNAWGGKSLYDYNSTGSHAADLVSYNRPFDGGAGTGDFLYRWEYNMVRFLEREGYDVTYCTSVDTDLRGSLIRKHKTFLVTGHSEYWSFAMRQNVQSAINNGVNAAFFSSNTCYWQVRFQPSAIDGAADRTIVGYKEDALTKDPYALDSDTTNDKYITVQWRQKPVNRPEAAMLGVQYIADPVDGDIVIDDVTSAPWVFQDSGLVTGSVLHGLLGYEVDKIASSSPANIVRLGHSPFTTTKPAPPQISDDSDMTVYTASSGALVFAAGTMQWSWGVDSWGNGASLVNSSAQQVTRNILRRFAGANAPADCQITLSQSSLSAPAAAGNYTVDLTTASTCSWTVATPTPWISISSPTSGQGPATVAFSLLTNGGAARTGTIRVGDQTLVVSQESGCAYWYSPSSASFASSGGSATISVSSSAADCPWTATASDSWITITSGASGVSGGTIGYTVAANGGSTRYGSIDVNGTYIQIQQANGCTYQTSPSSASFPSSGGTAQVTVTTDSSCYWTASTGTPWIVINTAAESSGNGVVQYTVQPNTTGQPRTGEIGVAAHEIPVTQDASACAVAVSPQNALFTSAAGTGNVRIKADSTCSWTATLDSSSFVTITSASTGSGNATLTYSVAANSASTARIATITINDVVVRIAQNPPSAATMNLTATASGTNSATLTWDAVPDATTYDVLRSNGPSGFVPYTTVTATSFNDSGLVASTTYIYQIRANGASGPIAYSNIDATTTIAFTDPVLTPGVTFVKAVHWNELRIAIDAMRTAALLPGAGYTDAIGSGVVIRLRQLLEMRSALDEARAAIGLPSLAYTDPAPVAGVTPVRTVHLSEMRVRVE